MTDLKNNFLVGGKIINNPIRSVINPGKINKRAANAKAAPEIISYTGISFFTYCLIADFKVLKPSYLA